MTRRQVKVSAVSQVREQFGFTHSTDDGRVARLLEPKAKMALMQATARAQENVAPVDTRCSGRRWPRRRPPRRAACVVHAVLRAWQRHRGPVRRRSPERQGPPTTDGGAGQGGGGVCLSWPILEAGQRVEGHPLPKLADFRAGQRVKSRYALDPLPTALCRPKCWPTRAAQGRGYY